jgi:hypothetical protein
LAKNKNYRKMLTVLTRTSNRPNYFKRCRRSVLEQTQRAFHIVSTDDPADTYPRGDVVVKVGKQPGHRGANLYFSDMVKKVPPDFQFIMFLDDDDKFCTPDAVETICRHIRTPDDMVLWRVDLGHKVVPPLHLMGCDPVAGEITGIGVAFHIKHWIDWHPTDFGDFKAIHHIWRHTNHIWIPEILTKMQTGPGMGLKNDLNLHHENSI